MYIMSLRTIALAIADKIKEVADYCTAQEKAYRQLQNEETLLMHMKYDKNKSVKFAKDVAQFVIQILLCPCTWVGATAAFVFTLPNGIPDPSYYQQFSLMIWCFSVSLWLAMNILNVRGKPEPHLLSTLEDKLPTVWV